MCEVRSRKNGQEKKKKKIKSTVVSSKKKSIVMSPIRRRMKKRNPSNAQNGQLLHWWLLIHSGPFLPPPMAPRTTVVHPLLGQFCELAAHRHAHRPRMYSLYCQHQHWVFFWSIPFLQFLPFILFTFVSCFIFFYSYLEANVTSPNYTYQVTPPPTYNPRRRTGRTDTKNIIY